MTAIDYIEYIINQLGKQHLAEQWQVFFSFCPRHRSVGLINWPVWSLIRATDQPRADWSVKCNVPAIGCTHLSYWNIWRQLLHLNLSNNSYWKHGLVGSNCAQLLAKRDAHSYWNMRSQSLLYLSIVGLTSAWECSFPRELRALPRAPAKVFGVLCMAHLNTSLPSSPNRCTS